jgi:outer membrane protein OmpA-like peptidoglycan-associated protein
MSERWFDPQKRANQVRIRVSSLGIPRERIDCIGYGYEKPRYV